MLQLCGAPQSLSFHVTELLIMPCRHIASPWYATLQYTNAFLGLSFLKPFLGQMDYFFILSPFNPFTKQSVLVRHLKKTPSTLRACHRRPWGGINTSTPQVSTKTWWLVGGPKKIEKIVNNPLPEGLQVGTSQSTSFLVAVKGLSPP